MRVIIAMLHVVVAALARGLFQIDPQNEGQQLAVQKIAQAEAQVRALEREQESYEARGEKDRAEEVGKALKGAKAALTKAKKDADAEVVEHAEAIVDQSQQLAGVVPAPEPVSQNEASSESEKQDGSTEAKSEAAGSESESSTESTKKKSSTKKR